LAKYDVPTIGLARNLLRDDGVMFISINDIELDNLRKICAEIFGEENFVEQFIVRSNPRGNQAKKLVASEHDYILCYSKNINFIAPLGFSKNENEFNKEDEQGSYREIGLRKRGAGQKGKMPQTSIIQFITNMKQGLFRQRLYQNRIKFCQDYLTGRMEDGVG
jgi:adenine-specific DNA-methyltransferase